MLAMLGPQCEFPQKKTFLETSFRNTLLLIQATGFTSAITHLERCNSTITGTPESEDTANGPG